MDGAGVSRRDSEGCSPARLSPAFLVAWEGLAGKAKSTGCSAGEGATPELSATAHCMTARQRCMTKQAALDTASTGCCTVSDDNQSPDFVSPHLVSKCEEHRR